ncbi:MAG: DEAD/DEAH box helicase [Candidatus Aenigmatarchaeota archaeon]
MKELKIPQKFIDMLGIKELNPVQKEAVKKGLFEKKNMVIASPTASGKTLVAELAMIKHFVDGGKTVYLVPLKALASEKYRDFKKKYSELGLKVAISIGDYDSSGGWLGKYDVIICTNEKLDSLIRHQVSWIKNVTLVITDEVHLLHDYRRGPIIEFVLTQLRRLTSAQLIALSATISNADEIAKWLDAKLVKNDYRPVKLFKGVLYQSNTVDNLFEYTLDFIDKNERKILGKDGEGALCKDVLEMEKQSLVFLGTRRSAESVAEKLAKITDGYLNAKERSELNKIADSIENTLPSTTKQCRKLASVVRKGSAFHHAGLVARQRELIEDNFRLGLIKSLSATPTLCLDADTKIWGKSPISINDIRQNKIFILNKNKLFMDHVHDIHDMDAPKEMIKITTIGNSHITTTTNHRMLINGISKPEIIEASKCKAGMKIATVGNLKVQETRIPKWSDFVINNKLPFENKELSPDMFYLIGAMLGDGYSGAEFDGNIIIYKGNPQIVNNDEDLLNRINKICKKNNIGTRRAVNTYGTSLLVLTKSNWFREFLVRCGVDIGQYKTIDKRILDADDTCIKELLRGLFDTDGCVEKTGKISFSSISKQLIENIRFSLLRFGIVVYIRSKPGSKINITERVYETKESNELLIHHRNCILHFHRDIGFHINRKQKKLIDLVEKLSRNITRVSCNSCKFSIDPTLFSGRNDYHKGWNEKMRKTIEELRGHESIKSRDLVKVLGFEPWKNQPRLNRHFELIERTRKGNTKEWKLNDIGRWIYDNVIIKDENLLDVLFVLKKCPLCENRLSKTLRGNWKSNDFDGDIFWEKIKSVEVVPSSENKVYDIVLSPTKKHDNFFVANGFIVHNSYGINIPAYRVIIRDVKRFSGHGADFLPVLDILQMCGRAGRPSYDDVGEAVIVAKNDTEAEYLKEKYFLSETEPIESRLDSLSILRMYTLVLIASETANSKSKLYDFFKKTFYAHQNDFSAIEKHLVRILKQLEDYKFIESGGTDVLSNSEFVPAFEIDKDPELRATKIGKRISELYIDPLSGWEMMRAVRENDNINYLMTITRCSEMAPGIRVKKEEYEDLGIQLDDSSLKEKPDNWDIDYPDYLARFKLSLLFLDWMDEKGEDKLLEKYEIPPGELYNKLKNAEWMLYAFRELATAMDRKDVANMINKLVIRLKHGVKEELLKLVMIKNIGRIRARKLWNNRIRTPADIKKARPEILAEILGPQLARKIREEILQTKQS